MGIRNLSWSDWFEKIDEDEWTNVKTIWEEPTIMSYENESKPKVEWTEAERKVLKYNAKALLVIFDDVVVPTDL